MQLMQGDCLEMMKNIPDGSVDMVLTDPPYNIGKADWDKIDGYVDWCADWLSECCRVLRDNGTLIFWHNDMPQIAELMHMISDRLPLVYNSFGVWCKNNFRAIAWKNTNGGSTQRSWFNVTEMFFVYIKPAGDGKKWNNTGLDCINSNPECYKPLKDWYHGEMERLGLDNKKIGEFYTEVTGKKPHMLHHYFNDSQFAIPTQEVWETVYEPLGFGKDCESLRKDYESLRKEYEELRPVFNILPEYQYSNIFTKEDKIFAKNSPHPCAKPLNILEKLIKVHSRPGDVVLDCFMGGGSTGVACKNTGRDFIGIELDEHYFNVAKQRIEQS